MNFPVAPFRNGGVSSKRIPAAEFYIDDGYFYAKAEPSSLQRLNASSSGKSLQITASCAITAPSAAHCSSQFLIHSPSPHP